MALCTQIYTLGSTGILVLNFVCSCWLVVPVAYFSSANRKFEGPDICQVSLTFEAKMVHYIPLVLTCVDIVDVFVQTSLLLWISHNR